ncbi:MAG: PAS domain S-box protein [Planctomycetes bacterium]|nr:PAS domain S-box protein [Planctomycetota bacterium]
MQLRAKLITERPSPGSYSAAQLMAVFENALDAVIVIDEKGVISFFNASAVRMFGYSAREVVGQNVKILTVQRKVALQARPDLVDVDSRFRQFFSRGSRVAELRFGVVAAVIGDPRGGVLKQYATSPSAKAEAQQPLRQRVADLIDRQTLGRIRRFLVSRGKNRPPWAERNGPSRTLLPPVVGASCS